MESSEDSNKNIKITLNKPTDTLIINTCVRFFFKMLYRK